MDKIAVLDFGGQYTHLISERLRDIGFYAEVLACETPAPELKLYKGIILSGGPKSVYDSDAPMPDSRIFSLGIPVLGICYGAQLMAQKLGGSVSRGRVREYGKTGIGLEESQLFSGLGKEETVWMSHGDSITKVPEGFDVLARSRDGIVAAISSPGKVLYGVQFHPEVSHTPKGKHILDNFASSICGCSRDWTERKDIEEAVSSIRKEAGGRNVGALTSFGVDSSVSAKLALMTLGDKVPVIYISGIDRKRDTENARRLAREMGIRSLVVSDATEIFARAIQGLEDPTDPQAKRRAIGNTYIDVFDIEIRKMGWDTEKTCLVQGTLYTDRIESGEGIGRKAANIKAHHNVDAGRIKEKAGKGLIIEPNKWKYKDGSRKRAAFLGLPDEIIHAKPFPGPGLVVRMINGVYMPENMDGMFRKVNRLALKHGMQGFVFPIRTVGVVGDERAYMNLAVIAGNPDFSARRDAARDIVNQVKGIGRVAFTFDGKLDQSGLMGISILPFNAGNLRLLREIDCYVTDAVEKEGIDGISQMPVILFPGPGKPWVAIRPVNTIDYMTAEPVEFPQEFARKLSLEVMRFGIGGVVFDDTDKPPGTIEWE